MSPPKIDETARHGLPSVQAASQLVLYPEYTRQWAVIIGIDEYQYLKPLKYAVNDARGIAKQLIEDFDFLTDDIFLLENAQATKGAIEDILINRLPSETKPDDCVLIFFAGHGEKRKLPNGIEKGYLAPVNAEPEKWTTFLAITDLLGAAHITSAKHIFFIVDSCYSGFASTRASNFQANRFQRDLLTNRARQVLTAGLDDQVVDDIGPNGHSLFTYHLLAGLKGNASYSQDSTITASELMVYVKNEVGKNNDSRQTPDYGLLTGHESGGDFVFIRKSVPDTPNNQLRWDLNDDIPSTLELLGQLHAEQKDDKKKRLLQAVIQTITDTHAYTQRR